MGKFAKQRAAEKKPRKNCIVCGKLFSVKPSHYSRLHACSMECSNIRRKYQYAGKSNPRYKHGKGSKGYLSAYCYATGKTESIHHIVVMAFLGIDHVPSGYGVHHRDNDKFNNDPRNLALLTHSDHRWLHWQFTAGELSAYMRGGDPGMHLRSDDPDRAKQILEANIIDQRGHFEMLKHVAPMILDRMEAGFGSGR